MANQLKRARTQEVLDIAAPPGEVIVETDDLVARREEPFAEVGAEEAGAPGDKDSFTRAHIESSLVTGYGGVR